MARAKPATDQLAINNARRNGIAELLETSRVSEKLVPGAKSIS